MQSLWLSLLLHVVQLLLTIAKKNAEYINWFIWPIVRNVLFFFTSPPLPSLPLPSPPVLSSIIHWCNLSFFFFLMYVGYFLSFYLHSIHKLNAKNNKQPLFTFYFIAYYMINACFDLHFLHLFFSYIFQIMWIFI